jgi:hypothetical protein
VIFFFHTGFIAEKSAPRQSTFSLRCGMAVRRIHFLWRPFLPDPADDMVLELAVAARATHIITFNLWDFAEAERVFGIKPVTPGDFLASLPPSP